jgi:hypothetical protein
LLYGEAARPLRLRQRFCAMQHEYSQGGLQKIRERFVGEFLEGHHTVVRYEPELRPAFIIDLNALTGHARRPLKYLTCPTAF